MRKDVAVILVLLYVSSVVISYRSGSSGYAPNVQQIMRMNIPLGLAGNRDSVEAVELETIRVENAQLKAIIANLKEEIETGVAVEDQKTAHDWTFCPDSIRDPKFHLKLGLNFTWRFWQRGELDYERAGPNEQAIVRDQRWWCDKFWADVPLKPLPPPPHLVRTDVVMGLLGGNNIIYSRGAAARDTWGTWFPNTYLFTIRENKALPSVGLADVYPEFKIAGSYLTDSSSRSMNQIHLFNTQNIGEVNMFGWKYMLERHPGAKWYVFLGDDIWIDPEAYLTELGKINAEKYPWIAWTFTHVHFEGPKKHTGRHTYLFDIAKHYEDTWVYGKAERKIAWTNGAYGIVLGRTAVEAIVDNFMEFRKLLPGGRMTGANDVDTGALLSFLGFQPTTWKSIRPQFGSAMDSNYGVIKKVREGQVMFEHYVTPMRMYNLEHISTRRRIDQLALVKSDKKRLVEYFREFADMHFHVLRRKAREMRQAYEDPDPYMVVDTRAYGRSLWYDIESLKHEYNSSLVDWEFDEKLAYRRYQLDFHARKFGMKPHDPEAMKPRPPKNK